MKTNRITFVAGVALAVSQLVSLAQTPAPGQPADPTEPPRRIERVIEEGDFGRSGIAHAAAVVRDVQGNVRRLFGPGGDSMDRPLIVSVSSPDEKSVATLEEDISVMARILEKSIDRGEEGDRKAMGIHLFTLGQGGRGARNMYFEGHGAIFLLNVNMPLLPAGANNESEEKQASGNSTWEQARNELFGGEGEGKPAPKESRLQPFSQKRYDDLKNGLLEALKNATHIRGLKEDEFVTIVVQGPAGDATGRPVNSMGTREGRFESFVFSGPAPLIGPRSTLTLRAKKSDIDAFAKGDLPAAAFRKKINTATYQSKGATVDHMGKRQF